MRRAGFTLVEVMVAISLVLLAAITLGSAYLNVLLGYEHAERSTTVDADVRFAREMLFRQPDRDLAEEGEEFGTADGRRVVWVAQIDETSVADLFEVRFQVELIGSGEAETVIEEFRLLRPTWSEETERDQLRQEMRDDIDQYLRGRRDRR